MLGTMMILMKDIPSCGCVHPRSAWIIRAQIVNPEVTERWMARYAGIDEVGPRII